MRCTSLSFRMRCIHFCSAHMCLKVRPSRLLIVVTTIFAISQASQWSATTRSSHYFLAFVVTHGALAPTVRWMPEVSQRSEGSHAPTLQRSEGGHAVSLISQSCELAPNVRWILFLTTASKLCGKRLPTLTPKSKVWTIQWSSRTSRIPSRLWLLRWTLSLISQRSEGGHAAGMRRHLKTKETSSRNYGGKRN